MNVLARILALSTPGQADGCWLWGGHVKANGYGTIGVKSANGWKTEHAHRASYQAFIGSIPDGCDLDHTCRVRGCVNPNHLEPVSRSENLKRSPLMGRQAHKLTCPKGHPYSGTDSRGARTCRICSAETTRRYRERKAT